jgi:hypothetical protein
MCAALDSLLNIQWGRTARQVLQGCTCRDSVLTAAAAVLCYAMLWYALCVFMLHVPCNAAAQYGCA